MVATVRFSQEVAILKPQPLGFFWTVVGLPTWVLPEVMMMNLPTLVI